MTLMIRNTGETMDQEIGQLCQGTYAPEPRLLEFLEMAKFLLHGETMPWQQLWEDADSEGGEQEETNFLLNYF